MFTEPVSFLDIVPKYRFEISQVPEKTTENYGI